MAKKAKIIKEKKTETEVWPVIELIEELSINYFGRNVILPCSGFAKGCIGVMPVFMSEETAKDWADDQETVRKWSMIRGVK
jgi:hypothetical protein